MGGLTAARGRGVTRASTRRYSRRTALRPARASAGALPSLSAPKRPKMAESSLFSAGGHLPLTQAVPGNLRTGPGGPAGPPYGRTEHGRSRGARGRTSRVRKGVKKAGPEGGTHRFLRFRRPLHSRTHRFLATRSTVTCRLHGRYRVPDLREGSWRGRMGGKQGKS